MGRVLLSLLIMCIVLVLNISGDSSSDKETIDEKFSSSDTTKDKNITVPEQTDFGNGTNEKNITKEEIPSTTVTIVKNQTEARSTSTNRDANKQDNATSRTTKFSIPSTSPKVISSTAVYAGGIHLENGTANNFSESHILKSSSDVGSTSTTALITTKPTTTTILISTIKTASPSITTHSSSATTQLSETTSSTTSSKNPIITTSGFNWNYLYFILLLLPLTAIPAGIFCFYQKKKKRKKGHRYMKARQETGRQPTPSWIFRAASDSDIEDVDV